MKKVLFVFAIATSLVACGGSTSTEVATDSTAVDSVVTDSNVSVDTTVVIDTATAVK